MKDSGFGMAQRTDEKVENLHPWVRLAIRGLYF